MHAFDRGEVHEEPLNREPSTVSLTSSFLTTSNGYDRNHGPIPQTDKTPGYTLNVYPPSASPDSETPKPIHITLQDIHKQPQQTVIAALQCAGNRRQTMQSELGKVQGIEWSDGAVMNCEWSGVRCRDVLIDALPGVEALAKDNDDGQEWHVQFECNQQETQEDKWYGASVPLKRVMDEAADVMLAIGMNGSPLTEKHGAPLRLVVPGICGARSVKWLDTIRIMREESQNHYQQKDYKILPKEATDSKFAEKFWSHVGPLMDMPVNSVVAWPRSGEEVELSEKEETGQRGLEATGYALPAGMDGPIKSVDVSLDEGRTWRRAELEDPWETNSKWAWSRWRTWLSEEELKITGRPFRGSDDIEVTVLSRASDAGGNQQDSCEWNLRGIAYNGYGQARDVILKC